MELPKLLLQLVSQHTPVFLGSILCLPVLYYVCWLCFLDPLRHIPGPWYCRLSSIWVTFQGRLRRGSFKIHELHRRYGDVVRISSDHVSIDSPDALREIYSHDRVYPKGPWYDPFYTPMPALIATFDADEHAEQRKNISPAFSMRALRDFEPHMSANHLRFKERLFGLFDEGQTRVEVDLNGWVNLLAFDTIADFSFGKTLGFLDRGYDFMNLAADMDRRLDCAAAIGHVPRSIRPLMMYLPDRFWRAGPEAFMRMRALVRSSYQDRMASGDRERKDLMNFMLDAKSEGGESLPEGRILSQSTAMIIAGSDSTAGSTAHIIDRISRDMDLQAKMRAEIDEVFPGEPERGWIPLEADTSKLTYTKAVFHEVLRLLPTLHVGLQRRVTRPGTMFKGHEIPPGTSVSVPTYTVHRNAEVFPDPESFRPERWLADDISRLNQTFSLFSLGPRSCIGKNFAWMEMFKTVVILLKHFRIRRATTAPTKLKQGMMMKPTECRVILEKRY